LSLCVVFFSRASHAHSLKLYNVVYTIQFTEGMEETRLVLTKPLTIDGESNTDYAAPNPLQLVLSLFKNVMPGSDLTRLQASQTALF